MISESDIETIKADIKNLIDTLIKGYETMDMNIGFKVFSQSPDFYMIAFDGKEYDYQSFMDSNKVFLDSCKTFELYTEKMDIKVLTPDFVVVSWLYKAVATHKSSRKETWENAAATFLFKKIGHEL